MTINDNSRFNGLSEKEVAEKQKRDGLNELPGSKKRGALYIADRKSVV